MRLRNDFLQKRTGAYYTPEAVVTTLLRWAVFDKADRFLDPACGDGRFIAEHVNSVGIEQNPDAVRCAMERAPWALVHEGDFFTWAEATVERFSAVGGNPPFIRYQSFSGDTRARAQTLCRRLGADFSGLASSWPLFLVASASLLIPGGRMAFVVPAEIGHAPYAAPLIEYLVRHFSLVQIVAVRERLFPRLSEDCWLLYAEGAGGRTEDIQFSAVDRFDPRTDPRRNYTKVRLSEWRTQWSRRLRPFLLPAAMRETYSAISVEPECKRFAEIAQVGIGYVTGSNEFFHLRPSQADALRIPYSFLRPTVRKAQMLPSHHLTKATVERWYKDDAAVLLLNIPKSTAERDLPAPIRAYLGSEDGRTAQRAFKCRNRTPWYSIPDVQTPDFFLSYMSGLKPSLVRNDALCTCTNSLHSVRFSSSQAARSLSDVWATDFLRLSCELEGHPLGGGILKLEPREAARIVIPSTELLARVPTQMTADAVRTMRRWRHYDA